MSQASPSRQPRGHNVWPTKKEVAGYFELLRGAAKQGDVDAARHLIDLHERNQRQGETAR
ncbi:hypothetical protein RSO41_14125 [Halomonas sp. I1]|uniref:hypothetical protein n=1 Tax=Halomonas sp. I1 TaxID=393536 RepID=UPI0028DF6A70|nr:hypothetical protein [Halomonas sp. I1]MDT8895791.1 hypothetical protein [Halomonas sp. I1]